MIPIWVPADSGDEVANRLRASCVSFLGKANDECILPFNSQHPCDMSALRVYKCLVDRPFKDTDVVQRYVWYKAVPAWASSDFWTVRIDHFIAPFAFPILNNVMEAEHGSDKMPVTFFTTKTTLPGGMYIYHRFIHENGLIQRRNLLGFLDPTATADINATRPLLRDAFHLPPEMWAQDQSQGTSANGMLYGDAWLKASKISSSAVRFQGNFVKSDELEDPFGSPVVGSRSGGGNSGNLKYNSAGTSHDGNKNQFSPTYTSNVESGQMKFCSSSSPELTARSSARRVRNLES